MFDEPARQANCEILYERTNASAHLLQPLVLHPPLPQFQPSSIFLTFPAVSSAISLPKNCREPNYLTCWAFRYRFLHSRKHSIIRFGTFARLLARSPPASFNATSFLRSLNFTKWIRSQLCLSKEEAEIFFMVNKISSVMARGSRRQITTRESQSSRKRLVRTSSTPLRPLTRSVSPVSWLYDGDDFQRNDLYSLQSTSSWIFRPYPNTSRELFAKLGESWSFSLQKFGPSDEKRRKRNLFSSRVVIRCNDSMRALPFVRWGKDARLTRKVNNLMELGRQQGERGDDESGLPKIKRSRTSKANIFQ